MDDFEIKVGADGTPIMEDDSEDQRAKVVADLGGFIPEDGNPENCTSFLVKKLLKRPSDIHACDVSCNTIACRVKDVCDALTKKRK